MLLSALSLSFPFLPTSATVPHLHRLLLPPPPTCTYTPSSCKAVGARLTCNACPSLCLYACRRLARACILYMNGRRLRSDWGDGPSQNLRWRTAHLSVPQYFEK